MSSILCKFRCMSVTREHTSSSVRLLGVKDQGDPENALFWKFTPHAELTFSVPAGERLPFEPMQTFYVRLTRRDDLVVCDELWMDRSLWQVCEILISSSVSRRYTLRRPAAHYNQAPPPHQGELVFSVDNPDAIKVMAECIESFWSISIEPSDKA